MATTLITTPTFYPLDDGSGRVTATLHYDDGTSESLDVTYSPARVAEARARMLNFVDPAKTAQARATGTPGPPDNRDLSAFFAIWERNIRIDAHQFTPPPPTPVVGPDVVIP